MSSSTFPAVGSQKVGPSRTRVRESAAHSDAVSRYQLIVRNAPPETLERAYGDAFGELSPEQRARVLELLADGAPRDDRDLIKAANADDLAALALFSTRAEVREPGFLPEVFTREGSRLGSALFGVFAARFVASAAHH
jgi:hypothetical protein